MKMYFMIMGYSITSLNIVTQNTTLSLQEVNDELLIHVGITEQALTLTNTILLKVSAESN
jgi:hypothetical protein